MIDVVVCVAEGEEVRGRAPGARFVSAPTVWQARALALDESSADVVAYLDADVVIPDGWADALRSAWATAPRAIAAIGGPIAARGDVPAWAAGTLGLVDYGDEPADLDPLERTLFAGNLSIRRRALLGAGGLGAPLDGRDGRDWLSEEHEAQRQLGHWGWLVRYEPGLRAERIVETGGLARRRFRYGMRTGLNGARSPGAAARQAAASAAGAIAAVARGSRGLSAERAGRAAENAGVALSAVRRARSGQVRAFGDGTPRRDAALVLLYHRVAEGEPDPLGLCVSPEHFQEQLEVLAHELDVVPMADIAGRVREGRDVAGLAAVTFDDGYVDNLEVALPIVTAAGIPVTLFAATGHIASGRRFFWDETARLVCGAGARPKRLELDVDGLQASWPTASGADRVGAFRALHRSMQPRSAEVIEAVLAALRDWAGPDAAPPSDSTRPMTVAELRDFAAAPGVGIGAHTRNHVNLAHQPAEVARAEIEGSGADIAGWLGTSPAGLSYPFGLPRHDVSDEVRAATQAAGFAYAVVNQPVPVEPGDDVYALPRLFAPDLATDDFALWLRRSLR